jgi:hypothetical protein
MQIKHPKSMKLLFILLFEIVLLTESHGLTEKNNNSTTTIQKISNEWIFEKVTGSFLKFKNGKEFNTNLYELKYIGMVPNGNKAPFLIFSGRDCNECDANISIYIHSPSNGHLKVENGENRYGCPGNERDYENNSLLYKARAFYGHVLPGIKGVIWYQKQLMENNTWQSSIFLVNLSDGVKKETTLKNIEKLKLTLDLLKQGDCREINGINYHSEP